MPSLLDPQFLAWLENLRTRAGRVSTASGPGEHRSPGRGRSAEFSEHREYRPGDDPRQIDWRAWARLDRLFLKVFVEEREGTLSVLVDCSASMGAGGPAGLATVSKFQQARRLAAALAYLGLCGLNRVSVGLLQDRLVHWQPPVRGRSQAHTLFRVLQEARPGGSTDLNAALKEFAVRSTRPGRVVILSDFLQPGAGLEGLRALRQHREEVLVAQILDPGELAPRAGGELRLVDSETGQSREVTLDTRLVEAYRKALNDLCRDLETWCQRHGCACLRFCSDAPTRETVLQLLRRGGLVP